jgi:hypothetical protein
MPSPSGLVIPTSTDFERAQERVVTRMRAEGRTEEDIASYLREMARADEIVRRRRGGSK